MYQPLTLSAHIIQVIFVELLIACLGYAALKVIGRTSQTRKRHGRFVLTWVLLGWAAGSIFGLHDRFAQGFTPDNFNSDHAPVIGGGGFGLLIGWVVGMVHGGIVIWRNPSASRPTNG